MRHELCGTSRFVLLLAAGLLAGSVPCALAAPSVGPGGQIVLTQTDSGGTSCRIGGSGGIEDFSCVQLAFLGTDANPDNNKVRTRVAIAANGNLIGDPHYATARIRKSFELEGPPGNFVRARIASEFDFENLFLVSAAYNVNATLWMRVVDDGTGRNVATRVLFETSRSGDQGFTDLASATERQIIESSTSDFEVILERGREYRIVFELVGYVQHLHAIGLGIETDAVAKLIEVSVAVDEDEVERLAKHDEDVRGELADHDSNIRGELAQHDADIKALLEAILARQEEIVRLLLTPQGQRESDLGSWPLKPDGPGESESADPPADTEPPAADGTSSFVGLVVSVPSSLIGTWQVEGYSFEVSPETELQGRGNGRFRTGDCVEVELDRGVALSVEARKWKVCQD